MYNTPNPGPGGMRGAIMGHALVGRPGPSWALVGWALVGPSVPLWAGLLWAPHWATPCGLPWRTPPWGKR